MHREHDRIDGRVGRDGRQGTAVQAPHAFRSEEIHGHTREYARGEEWEGLGSKTAHGWAACGREESTLGTMTEEDGSDARPIRRSIFDTDASYCVKAGHAG